MGRYVQYFVRLLFGCAVMAVSVKVLDMGYLRIDHTAVAWFNPAWLAGLPELILGSLSTIAAGLYLIWAHRVRRVSFAAWIHDRYLRIELA